MVCRYAANDKLLIPFDVGPTIGQIKFWKIFKKSEINVRFNAQEFYTMFTFSFDEKHCWQEINIEVALLAFKPVTYERNGGVSWH